MVLHNISYGPRDLLMAHHHFSLKIRLVSDNIPMHLKDNLKKLIKVNGITVAHLSRSTRIPLQTLHGWLSGTEPKSVKQLKIIASYFEVTIDDLCFYSSNSSPVQNQENNKIKDYQEEINAGTFEVVLRRIKK